MIAFTAYILVPKLVFTWIKIFEFAVVSQFLLLKNLLGAWISSWSNKDSWIIFQDNIENISNFGSKTTTPQQAGKVNPTLQHWSSW